MSKFSNLILLFSLSLLQGCFVYGKKDMLSVDTVIKQKEKLSSSLFSVNVFNNQFIINGSGFSKVTSVKIKGSGVEADLIVNSKSDSQVVASAASALSFFLNGTFDLVIGTVDAQATFPITFSLQNGAIEASHLSAMGASSGQILKYNGSAWVASSIIEGQTYVGTWNATTNTPDLSSPSSTAGDYYIVTGAGSLDGINYGVGDWIISDGYNWQKIEYSKTSVTSFQGRKGIVTLVPGDYVSLKDGVTGKITGSSLNDLVDLDLTTVAPVNGSILKYNGTKWVTGVDSTGIAAGSIVDADISGTAEIAQSKISGLATALSGKQDVSSLADDVRAIPLTGIASTSGAVVAGDTILGAFGKLLNAQSDYVSKSTGATITTGTIAVGGTGMITIPTATGTTATEAANVTYVANAIDANGVWEKDGSTINYTTGNVGIGVESPAHVLSVGGDGTNTAAFFNGRSYFHNGAAIVPNSNSTSVIDAFTTTGSSNNIFRWGPTYVNSASISGTLGYSGTGSVNISASNADMAFLSGSTEKIRFSRAGNIGIATSSPTAKLSIASSSTSSGAVTLTAANTATTFTTSASTTLNVGDYIVPATTPAQSRVVSVGGTGTSFTVTPAFSGAVSGETFTIYPASMNIDSGKFFVQGNTGFVGIGTSAPATILDINATTVPTAWNTPTGLRITSPANGFGYALQVVPGGNNALAVTNTANILMGGGSSFAKVSMESAGNQLALVNTSTANGSSADITFVSRDLSWNFLNLGKIVSGKENNVAGAVNSYLAFLGMKNSTAFEALRINSSGNLGVGTTDPHAGLEVAKNAADSTPAQLLSGEWFVSGTTTTNKPMLLIEPIGATSTNWSANGTGLGVNAPNGFGGKLMELQVNGVHKFSADAYGAVVASKFHASTNVTTPVLIGGSSAGVNLSIDSTSNVSKGHVLIASSGGNVGIGTSGPGYKLDVQGGDINASGNVLAAGVALTSDRRWKQNIAPLENSMEKIKQLNGVSYDWAIEDYPEKHFSDRRQIGIIAQDVEKVFPELVTENHDGYLSVNYPALIAPLIEAFKSQQRQIEANVRMFKAMQGEIEGIMLMVEENKRAIASNKSETDNRITKLEAMNSAKDREIAELKVRLIKIENLLLRRSR